MKAKAAATLSFKFVPVRSRGFQEGVCADDVGLDEGRWSIDGPVHMRFGGEVHHSIGPVVSEDCLQCSLVTDIDLLKGVARGVIAAEQGFQVPRISQFVDVDHRVGAGLEHMPDHGRADKSSAPRYENLHLPTAPLACVELLGATSGRRYIVLTRLERSGCASQHLVTNVARVIRFATHDGLELGLHK